MFLAPRFFSRGSRNRQTCQYGVLQKGFFSRMIFRFDRLRDNELQQYIILREDAGSFRYSILSSDESRTNILERVCSIFPASRISVHSVTYDNSILLEDNFPDKHGNDGFYEITTRKWHDIKDRVLFTPHITQNKTTAMRAVNIPQQLLAWETDM